MRPEHLYVRLLLASVLLVIASACSHDEPFVRGTLRPGDPPSPPAEAILQRFIFIGDAGAPSVDGEPVLSALRDTASSIANKTVVVFLGDNIYPAGLPPEDDAGRADAERALRAQVAAAGAAQAVFIAGNHDWGNRRRGEGPATLERQANWLEDHSDARMLPEAGCFGPSILDLTGVRLVTLDTQWWFESPEHRTVCSADVEAALAEALSPNDHRPVVVVGHHPLQSRGPHGGFNTVSDWLIPSQPEIGKWGRLLLPLPGIRPIVRLFQRSDQDFGSETNREFRRRITNVFASNPPLIYASGHEHSLQVFDGGPFASMLLVSGAGSSANTTPVGHNDQTLFAHSHPGFMVVDVLQDRALLRVIEPGGRPITYWNQVKLRN